jgi:REP element-mobilizing transposase RayT
MNAKQLSIFDLSTSTEKRSFAKRTTHGGTASKGKRKLSRPIATKKWMHLVLKAPKAKGTHSMLNQKHVRNIESIITGKAKKFRADLKEFVNMGNHIHFQVRVKSRESFQNFLRAITCLIARVVTGAKRGVKFGKFWDGLAFSRIISTLDELVRLEGYLQANTIERRHGYQARTIYLNALNKWIKKLKSQGIRPITS